MQNWIALTMQNWIAIYGFQSAFESMTTVRFSRADR